MVKEVLGVKIDDVSEEEALARIVGWLKDKKSVAKVVVTPGPEFLLTAQKDEEFRRILNKADLSVPDGFGLKLYGGVQNVVHGVDLLLRLCEEAATYGWTVGLLGGQEGVAQGAAEILRRKYPGIKINFALDGEEADQYLRYYGILNDIIIPYDTKVKKLPPIDLFFVALGHPKQEKLLWRLRWEMRNGKLDVEVGNEKLSKNQKISIQRPASHFSPHNSKPFRVGMGVGGSFDFISGNLPRAPKWMSDFGFEWLWRVMTKPRHFRRVWRATVQFPLEIMRRKLESY